MSFSSPNIADRMLANDIKSQMLQVERKRVSDENRSRVNKAYEQAISSSKPKCTCNCHSRPVPTDKEIEEDMEWERKHRKEWRALSEKTDKRFEICTIL